MYEYIVNHLTHEQAKFKLSGKDMTRRPRIPMNPVAITIHSTGNPKSTARNERLWLQNPSNNRLASYHIVIDEKEAIECLPLNEVGWHAANRQGNLTTIGIEICESGDRKRTLENAEMLVAKLLYDRNWGIDKLRRHYDWSGKNCPRILNYDNWKGWTVFKNNVQIRLDNLKLNSSNKNITEIKDPLGGNISNPSQWAERYWKWAIQEGFIKDNEDPKYEMSREDMAKEVKKIVNELSRRDLIK